MAGSRDDEDEQHDDTEVKNNRVWLSDLPNEILLHILSFLLTKPLVRTSILARRWQYLWASTPNLHLDRSMFRYDHDRLINFAERAFVLRNGSSLVSFSLSSDVDYNYASRDINTLIRLAMRYNVEQLSLTLYGDDRVAFLFPCCVFECQSLVRLSLQLGITIRLPSMVCLPRLKHLELTYIAFVDDESTEKLLSHPSLEELIISYCDWQRITTVKVNSPKLRILAIDDDYYPAYCNSPSDERQLCFFGDDLKIFRYKGLLPFQYSICGSTKQLREAELWEGIGNIHWSLMYFKRYCKLLNSLSSVQNLTLEEYFIMDECFGQHVGPSSELTFPVFEHVTRLNLSTNLDDICIDGEWFMMIIERCPRLEHLNFMPEIDFSVDPPVMSPIPSCFRTHLKKITFYSNKYEVLNDVNEAIDMLLCGAPLLEQMVLHIRSTSDHSWVEEAERKLNARPKVSENCRVSIVAIV